MRGLTDLHCHLLPGVDDGAASAEEMKELLRMEYEQGVRRIIFTPHYRREMFETPTSEILRRFTKVKSVLEASGIDMKVYLGRECFSSSKLVDMMSEDVYLLMNKTRFILVEFPYKQTFQKIRNRVYDLLAGGAIPILAHVERYSALVEKPERIAELIELGAYIQVNAGAILGDAGWSQKRFCLKLMKNNYIHFVGTDAHDTKHRKPNLGRCKEYVERKMGAEYADRLFFENPQMLFKRK